MLMIMLMQCLRSVSSHGLQLHRYSYWTTLAIAFSEEAVALGDEHDDDHDDDGLGDDDDDDGDDDEDGLGDDDYRHDGS